MRKIEEGKCYEMLVLREGSVDDRFRLDEEWLEVTCYTHDWECGHKHTRWGPVLRCVARHVASMVDEDRSDEVDDPVRSDSEQVTSESPSAVS